MKRLYITEIGNSAENIAGRLELREMGKPVPRSDEVLIKVAYSCICGSDGHTVRGSLGDFSDRLRGMLPMTVGHEISGVIESVGENAKRMGFAPGNRVTGSPMQYCGSCVFCHTGKENFCQNKIPRMDGIAEYVCWHMSQVFKLPDDVDLRHGALTEPVSVAFGAAEMVNVRLGSRVAIFGGGGIGQLAAQVARLAGAALVAVIEPVADKRTLALRLGADFTIDPAAEDVKTRSDELTGSLGFDSVIEASGAAVAAAQALDILTPDGDVVYFSMYDPTFMLPLNLFWQQYWQQKHIHGMFNSNDIFPRVTSVLNRLELESLIQREYPLSDYEQAFSDQFTGKYAKVMLKCNDL